MKDKRNKISKNSTTAIIVLVSVIFIGFSYLYFQNVFQENKDNSRTTNDASIISKLPKGWNTELSEVGGCYTINISSKGKYDKDLKDIINEEVFGGREDGRIYDANTYDINSVNVIDLGTMGVGNYNTIYLKSNSNIIYSIEVNGKVINNEYQEKVNCSDLKPVIQTIVRGLIY